MVDSASQASEFCRASMAYRVAADWRGHVSRIGLEGHILRIKDDGAKNPGL